MRPREQPRDCCEQHQRRAHDDGAGAVSLADLERRRDDVEVFLKVLVGRYGEQEQECHHEEHAEGVEPFARFGAHVLHERRELHVLAAAQRNDRSQHREPHEQDARKLVGPGDRLVQHITREGAAAQDDDLGENEKRRRDLGGMGERAGPSRCGRRLVGNRFAELHPDPPSSKARAGFRQAGPSTSPECPKLRVRTCPSTRCRSRRT